MSLDNAPNSTAELIIDAELSTAPHSPPADPPPPQAEEPPQGENGATTPPNSQPIPEPDPVAIAAEAEKLKEQGNNSFKVGRYGEAIDLYTKAIGACIIQITLSQGPARIDAPTDDMTNPTTRPSPYRARLPHEPCSGVHRHQALPPRARGLPPRGHAASHGIRRRRGAAQDASTTRALPARARADHRGALNAARSARCRAGQRARGADARARARARGAHTQPRVVAAAQGVGHGAHRARPVYGGHRGGGERDSDRVAAVACRARACARKLGRRE